MVEGLLNINSRTLEEHNNTYNNCLDWRIANKAQSVIQLQAHCKNLKSF